MILLLAVLAGAALAPAAAAQGGGAQPGTQAELLRDLLARMSAVEEELRRLRGQLEVAQQANRELAAEVEKLRGDTDFRLQALEGTGGAGVAPAARPAPAPPRVPAPTPPVRADGGAAPSPSAEAAIREGEAALRRSDFAAAEAAAQAALQARPGPQGAAARVLLGKALLGQRQYQRAVLAFTAAYEADRRGRHAPEALLGRAQAFHGYGADREACMTLNLLGSDFSDLTGPVVEAAAALRQRAGCGG